MVEKDLSKLLKKAGDSAKAMRHVAGELRELGLTALADTLERAESDLSPHIISHHDDTQPISIV